MVFVVVVFCFFFLISPNMQHYPRNVNKVAEWVIDWVTREQFFSLRQVSRLGLRWNEALKGENTEVVLPDELGLEEAGIENKSTREEDGFIFEWVWEVYSRWLDLASYLTRLCSSGVLLGMKWEDERRKMVRKRCFKKPVKAQAREAELQDGFYWTEWLIFLHPVDKHTLLYTR